MAAEPAGRGCCSACATATGRQAAQYIDVERCATTPERFLQAVTSASPFRWHGAEPAPATAREAFDALLAFFDTARAPGGEPCTFLLDEVLELRTFESFPGLRHVLRELLDALAESPNRFVLTTRYVARAHRLLRDATARFEVMHQPALTPIDVTDVLAPVFDGYEQMASDDRDDLGRTVTALTDGRAVYVKAIGETMGHAGAVPDPISALTALVGNDGVLSRWCRFCYELRLHRARGYGALKAILDILAEEESLTLTEISQRLHRTPGSTKDYLSWLEDVDLVASRQKRYSFTDPAAAALGAAALPSVAADRRRGRARSPALCARADPIARGRAGPGLRRRRSQRGGEKELGDYRDRLTMTACDFACKFTKSAELRASAPPRFSSAREVTRSH